MDFVLAIAKALLSSLAAKIFNSVFPPGVPSYFAEILQEIKDLIHIEVVSNDITLIKGTVDGIISQMTIDYTNMKASPGVTNEQLIAFLAPIEATLDDQVMGPLEAITDTDQPKGVAQQSLIVYLLGGGMQFAVLQEMALHDPASPGNAAASQYAKDITSYETKYATRAQTLITALKASRMKDISGVQPDNFAAPAPAPPGDAAGWPGGVHEIETWVQDNWIGQKACVNQGYISIWTPIQQSDQWKKTTECRPGYVQSQDAKFESDWAKARETIGAWQVLQTKPVSGY